jgi:hypothetical protein
MGRFPVRDRLRVRTWREAPNRAGEALRDAALAATNDARVVAVILVLAAAALAWEMAVSFKL